MRNMRDLRDLRDLRENTMPLAQVVQPGTRATHFGS